MFLPASSPSAPQPVARSNTNMSPEPPLTGTKFRSLMFVPWKNPFALSVDITERELILPQPTAAVLQRFCSLVGWLPVWKPSKLRVESGPGGTASDLMKVRGLKILPEAAWS